jgi:hypothetical protein
MPATTDALARIHDALPDDAEIAALGHEFISLYLEYGTLYGYGSGRAEAAAIKEVIEGIRATVDLRAEGYIK